MYIGSAEIASFFHLHGAGGGSLHLGPKTDLGLRMDHFGTQRTVFRYVWNLDSPILADLGDDFQF
jgi:hypothetical protein